MHTACDTNLLKKGEEVQQEMADEIVQLCVETISSVKRLSGIIPRNTLANYKYFGNISPLILGVADYKISKSNVAISLDYSDYEGHSSNFPINYCEKKINKLLKPYGISVHYSVKHPLSGISCFIVKRTLYIKYNRSKKNDKRNGKQYFKSRFNSF